MLSRRRQRNLREEEEDRPDGWGPHGGETREKRERGRGEGGLLMGFCCCAAREKRNGLTRGGRERGARAGLSTIFLSENLFLYCNLLKLLKYKLMVFKNNLVIFCKFKPHSNTSNTTIKYF